MAQVVVITGATAGVGRAAAVEFAKRGDKVALIARGEQGLQGARRDVEAHGGQAITISADVADADQIEQAAKRVERELGPIDVWVNNAMTTVLSPVLETTPEEFRRATEVTYLGVVHGTLSALRRMHARNHGTIVQVGSALSYRAIPLQASYCAAKHAIRGFTDSLRCELLHDKSRVHVTMVQLPALNTPQFSWCKSRLPKHPQPVPPIYQPEVAARAIVWASEHRRREVHVGWSAVKAIWGSKFAPGLADRYLASKGYDGQQTDEPVNNDRPVNLFEPVDNDRDHGAHGIFDRRATASSTQLWFTTHRRWLALPAAVGVAALMLAGIASRK